ncbi:MAG: hypothetical protein QM723_18295 [Myxococcaceae bacterium]
MKRAAALVLAVVALGACSGCKHAAPPPDAGPAARARPASSEPWWLALPDLPDGGPDLSVVMIPRAQPDERMYGALSASFCGQDDLFLFERPLLWHDPAAGVACAKRLLELDPKGGVVWTIELDREAHPHALPFQLLATRLASTAELEPLVRGFHRETVAGFDALCRPFEGPERTCAERNDPYDEVLMVHDGYVISGKYPAFAELLGSPWGSWAIAHLSRTAEALPGGAQAVTFDLIPPGTRWMIGERRWLPYSRREETDALANAVRTNAKAVAWEESWDEGRALITLVPRCSGAGCPEREALLSAFRTYHQAWAAKASERLEQLFSEAGERDLTCERPHERAMVEAIKAARPEATPGGAIVFRYSVGKRPPPTKGCEPPDAEKEQAGIARVRSLLKAAERSPDNRAE